MAGISVCMAIIAQYASSDPFGTTFLYVTMGAILYPFNKIERTNRLVAASLVYALGIVFGAA